MRSWRATALLGAVVSIISLVLSSAEASASCWYEVARLEDGGGGCIDVYVYYSCFERDGRLVRREPVASENAEWSASVSHTNTLAPTGSSSKKRRRLAGVVVCCSSREPLMPSTGRLIVA